MASLRHKESCPPRGHHLGEATCLSLLHFGTHRLPQGHHLGGVALWWPCFNTQSMYASRTPPQRGGWPLTTSLPHVLPTLRTSPLWGRLGDGPALTRQELLASRAPTQLGVTPLIASLRHTLLALRALPSQGSSATTSFRHGERYPPQVHSAG